MREIRGWIVVDEAEEVQDNQGNDAKTPADAMILPTAIQATDIANQMNEDSTFGIRHSVKRCILKLEVLDA